MAIDLSNLLWPDVDQGRQPQGQCGVAPIPGLVFAANFTSVATQDLVLGGIGTKVNYGGNYQFLGANSIGLGIQGNTSSAGALQFNAIPALANNANITVIAAGAWPSEARRTAIVFIGDETAVPDAQYSFLINTDYNGNASAGTICGISYNNGFGYQAQSSATAIDGKPHIIGFCLSAQQVWRDGLNITYSAIGSPVTLSSAYPVYINNSNVPINGRSVTSPTNAVLIFDRILSTAEMAFYTSFAGFWQVFAPPIQNLYFSSSSGGGVTTISGSLGAYTYSGTTSTSSQLINQVAGAWSWAGSTSALSQLISQSVGNYSYAGTTATLSQLIKQVVGSYSWAGTTSTPVYCTSHTSIPSNAIPGCAWPGMGVGTQYINAAPGTYSWSGLTANVYTLLQASIGAYTWSGTTGSLSQLISQTSGSFSWQGTTSIVISAITGQVGSYTWSGTTATFGSTTITGSPGAYTWAGITANIPGLIAAFPGEYTWQGTTSSLIQLITISGSVGSYTWNGQTSSVVVPTVLTTNPKYIVKATNRSYIVKAPSRNYTAYYTL